MCVRCLTCYYECVPEMMIIHQRTYFREYPLSTLLIVTLRQGSHLGFKHMEATYSKILLGWGYQTWLLSTYKSCTFVQPIQSSIVQLSHWAVCLVEFIHKTQKVQIIGKLFLPVDDPLLTVFGLQLLMQGSTFARSPGGVLSIKTSILVDISIMATTNGTAWCSYLINSIFVNLYQL